MTTEIAVLDHGLVTLETHNADDLGVVNAARVSFQKQDETLSQAGERLIVFLLKNRHGTPFEHNFFRWRIAAPIFVFREWHRHRIGHSYNEMSGRYTELPTTFYVPADVVVQVGKPGAYTYEPANNEQAARHQDRLRAVYESATQAYHDALADGVAKQQARLCLPVAIYSEMIWSCNARSLMAWLSLRNHPAAQAEIREYAKAVETIFAQIMPVTHAAFVEHGRVAP